MILDYRALRAVLHIIDRKLDLSLLSDHRVLKERDATQEDGVIGALRTETNRERWDCLHHKAGGEGKAGSGGCTSMISVWACLVQKACGGVVQLTATKLVGLRSREGVTSSLQAAATQSHRRRLQTVGLNGGMVTNPWPWEESNRVLVRLSVLDEQQLFTVILSGWTGDKLERILPYKWCSRLLSKK